MVMDQEMLEMPAPDVVGREFVRQYYTLLHDAPEHAHRFYNSNSYFVHGSMTKPAVGQLEIHQKIQQLNFRDCHAKISQVDSQVTLGNGVVVHVSGELSNDGEPMRRFSQTFVLGTQSPKKYYVHNDIFRYQDTLQSDEEGEVSPDKEEPRPEIIHETPIPEFYPAVPVVEAVVPPVMPTQQQQVVPVNAVPQIPVNVNGTGSIMHEEPLLHEPELASAPLEPVAPSAPVMNGGPVMSSEDLARMMQPAPGIQESIPQQLPHPGGAGHLLAEEASPPKSTDSESGIKDDYEEESVHEPIHISESEEQPKQTFANLFKAGRGVRGLPRSVRGHPSPSAPIVSSPHSAPPIFSSLEVVDPMVDGLAQPPLSSGPRSAFPDSHQIFLGKLPPEATEKDLQSLFASYGKIMDLRIQPNKGTTSTKANFGFITFEDASAVQRCLSSKPIYFPMDGGPRVILNVEEKKPQHKGSRPPPADSGSWHMGRGGQSGRGRGNPRGAPRGRGSAPLPPRSFPSSRR